MQLTLKETANKDHNERVFRALFASDEPLAVFIKEVCEATGGCLGCRLDQGWLTEQPHYAHDCFVERRMMRVS